MHLGDQPWPGPILVTLLVRSDYRVECRRLRPGTLPHHRTCKTPQCAADEAEQTFRKAIGHARSQGAMLLALRAAVSLGRTLHSTERTSEARSLILEISQSVDQLAERDLDEAKALPGELAFQ